MPVVYYCAVNISDYIVLSCCLFGGGVNFWLNFWRWGQSGRDSS